MLILLSLGLFKQIFLRIKLRISLRNRFLGSIIPPILGGLIVGLINMELPLTVGSGSFLLQPILLNGTPNQHNNGDSSKMFSLSLLLCSLFGKVSYIISFLYHNYLFTIYYAYIIIKITCFAVSNNCGFIGGIIYIIAIIDVIFIMINRYYSTSFDNCCPVRCSIISTASL